MENTHITSIKKWWKEMTQMSYCSLHMLFKNRFYYNFVGCTSYEKDIVRIEEKKISNGEVILLVKSHFSSCHHKRELIGFKVYQKGGKNDLEEFNTIPSECFMNIEDGGVYEIVKKIESFKETPDLPIVLHDKDGWIRGVVTYNNYRPILPLMCPCYLYYLLSILTRCVRIRLNRGDNYGVEEGEMERFSEIIRCFASKVRRKDFDVIKIIICRSSICHFQPLKKSDVIYLCDITKCLTDDLGLQSLFFEYYEFLESKRFLDILRSPTYRAYLLLVDLKDKISDDLTYTSFTWNGMKSSMKNMTINQFLDLRNSVMHFYYVDERDVRNLQDLRLI